MDVVFATAQTAVSWHRRGLYMGMHWGWWLFWIVVLVTVVWAFWRLHVDCEECRREATRALQAEEMLRQRFARGEIAESDLVRSLEILRQTRTVRETREPPGAGRARGPEHRHWRGAHAPFQ